MKMKSHILWITQTAMLLGLTIATQYYLTSILSFNPFLSQLVVGSLVNLFLIISTMTCGFFSGLSISTIAPVLSLFIGRLPHIWMMPFIALGNISIVFIFWLICRKKVFDFNFSINWIIASVTGALLKFGVLWVGVTQIFVKFFLINDGNLQPPQIERMSEIISLNYSFPQIITAFSGCILGYAIYPVLKKAVIKKLINAEN